MTDYKTNTFIISLKVVHEIKIYQTRYSLRRPETVSSCRISIVLPPAKYAHMIQHYKYKMDLPSVYCFRLLRELDLRLRDSVSYTRNHRSNAEQDLSRTPFSVDAGFRTNECICPSIENILRYRSRPKTESGTREVTTLDLIPTGKPIKACICGRLWTFGSCRAIKSGIKDGILTRWRGGIVYS